MAREFRYARVGAQYVAYEVFGEGPLDLVIAPGYMSNLEQNWTWPPYARFFERLSSFARVMVLDRRGTGLSDRLIGTQTFDDLMDDIRGVMDDAGSDQAAVVGGAEGGPMCTLFAATYPERTSALILITTYARRMWTHDYPWGLTAEVDALVEEGYLSLWGRAPMGIRALAPGQADDPAFRDWYVRAQRTGGTPGAALAWYRITADIDVREVLPAIRVPTLVVHRTGDQAIPVEHGRYLADHIPGARYVELPGEDHFWFSGDSDAILAEIEEFLTGVRPPPPVDRVLATVMFTDIVDSTRRAAALGDRRWQDLLSRHNTLVRGELEQARGHEVKTTGDGFLATFDGPARAIRCAVAIAESAGQVGIDVRVGLHTGEVELVGDDVLGIAVHIGARITTLAGAGEVLVSGTVKDLVAGSGIVFDDRGDQTLKGVPGEWRVFAVRSRGQLAG
ncbi:MAG: adenylate/guanylate cyclase domain-containing protein [Acidimicrobiia bacterium]